ncbi:MAG TPA: biotin--[acetyl-CoA-carboxylase] ligase [Candidatus Udaeobacter sp.]|nr:biotin--[acetyl-CoA-carboxylase] ligase [Candidatus Udaeobacter sp.]
MHEDWTATDALDASAIRAALVTQWLGRPIEIARLVDSTNEQVRARARAGHPPGLCLLAEEQTAGRGRQGQGWISAPGAGVWMTALLPKDTPGLATLGAAAAVRRAIGKVTGLLPVLKWPNDLLLGEAKLCGILGEALPEGAIALGIGLNVHDSPPSAAGFRATHLERELGRPLARNLLAAEILNELEPIVDELRAGRTAPVLAAWRAGCDHLGRRVRIDVGSQSTVGTAVAIDENGALRLALADGSVVTVWAGSLRVEPDDSTAAPEPGRAEP